GHPVRWGATVNEIVDPETARAFALERALDVGVIGHDGQDLRSVDDLLNDKVADQLLPGGEVSHRQLHELSRHGGVGFDDDGCLAAGIAEYRQRRYEPLRGIVGGERVRGAEHG